jgi:hypothetical protein
MGSAAAAGMQARKGERTRFTFAFVRFYTISAVNFFNGPESFEQFLALLHPIRCREKQVHMSPGVSSYDDDDDSWFLTWTPSITKERERERERQRERDDKFRKKL